MRISAFGSRNLACSAMRLLALLFAARELGVRGLETGCLADGEGVVTLFALEVVRTGECGVAARNVCLGVCWGIGSRMERNPVVAFEVGVGCRVDRVGDPIKVEGRESSESLTS